MVPERCRQHADLPQVYGRAALPDGRSIIAPRYLRWEVGDRTRASNRGFWLVVGLMAAASGVLLALILLNRPAAERASEFTARDNLRTALAAAESVREQEGTFGAASALRLRRAEPDLLFIDSDESSNNAEVISVLATDSMWAAAARAETGACFWLRVLPGGPTVYGRGTNCSGQAAGAAAPAAWPSP
ncbi:MAG TPA: hypothetical protein VNA32_01320 [Actinomycetota bacterium]|nr:hypothetical protein [Actinomycetota bacterium]